jgi:hypothetical protein
MEVTVYIVEGSALLQKNPVSTGDVMPARNSESMPGLSLLLSQFKTAKYVALQKLARRIYLECSPVLAEKGPRNLQLII